MPLWWPVINSNHSVTFCGRGCRDTLLFICRVTSHDHVNKGSSNILCFWQPLVISNNPIYFGGYRSFGSRNSLLLLATCNQVNKSSHDFIVGNPSPILTSLPSLVAISLVEGLVEVEIQLFKLPYDYAIEGSVDLS